jgi:hypothetical protein
MKILDYQLITTWIESVGNFLTSSNGEVRRKAVMEECLQELLLANEYSQYYKIRRISMEYL